MEIEIRKATERDLPHILSLYSELDTDKEPVFPLDKALAIFDRIKNYPDYTIYVVTFNTEIIGVFSLLIMDNLAHAGAPSGIVEDVIVHGRWRGKGIGKKMMGFAMDRCKEKGCYKLSLSSNFKREDAHRFYETLGFQKHGYSFLIELKGDPVD